MGFCDNGMLGKSVFFAGGLYQIQEGNLGEGAISLKNIMTSDYLRHRNGIIENSAWEDDELFTYDSSFSVESEGGQARFYCTNEGLASYCIVDAGGIRIADKEECDREGWISAFPLLDASSVHIREHVTLPIDGRKKLIVFGSSGTEIFDYVFGDNLDYIPFWASGWSARGLRNVAEHIEPYRQYLEQLSSDSSTVLLQFGSVDIDFNLAFKAETYGYYKTEVFLREMVEGVLSLKQYLATEFGIYNVYAVFTAPTVELPQEYWRDTFGFYTLPNKMRAKMMWDFAAILASQMSVINCLPDLVESVENPICSRRYMREYPDHHIDFVAAQDIVYRKMKQYIPELPEQARHKHQYLYEHLIYGVDEVGRLNKARPRTCRNAG